MLQTLHEELLKLLLMLNKNEYYEKNIPREKKIFFFESQWLKFNLFNSVFLAANC